MNVIKSINLRDCIFSMFRIIKLNYFLLPTINHVCGFDIAALSLPVPESLIDFFPRRSSWKVISMRTHFSLSSFCFHRDCKTRIWKDARMFLRNHQKMLFLLITLLTNDYQKSFFHHNPIKVKAKHVLSVFPTILTSNRRKNISFSFTVHASLLTNDKEACRACIVAFVCWRREVFLIKERALLSWDLVVDRGCLR